MICQCAFFCSPFQASNSIESKFYMLKAKPCRYIDGETTSEMDASGAQLYLQPSHFMELDKFMLLRGPTTSLDENSLTGENIRTCYLQSTIFS